MILNKVLVLIGLLQLFLKLEFKVLINIYLSDMHAHVIVYTSSCVNGFTIYLWVRNNGYVSK